MRNNKQGMVMVYVIVFLLVSQLIYWGLLRLNQINLSRYLNFNDYYTANIQEELVMNLLPPIERFGIFAQGKENVPRNKHDTFDRIC